MSRVPDDPNFPAQETHNAVPRATRPESVTVVMRFMLRMVILAVFATFGSLGFPKTLETLLAMATLYCAIVGSMRREAPLGPALTHFDEGAAYALCAFLAARAA